MSLTDLLNKEMTIVRRSGSEIDEYGDEIPDEQLVNVLGELQQRQRSEPGDQGELSATEWLAVLPAGTAIDTGDGIIYAGQVFEVVGDPWDAEQSLSPGLGHVEVTLRRTAGEESGS